MLQRTDPTYRRELLICGAVAVVIVLIRAFIPLRFEQVYDPDQAVWGLMAKHLSEGRAFPLFFYGQSYMIGLEAWLAVPFFWIGGPTVLMQRLPLLLFNLGVALGFFWTFARFGLKPRYALAAALPVIAFSPAMSLDYFFGLGVGIEPFLFVLILWLIRDRPIAFGVLLCFATLHREFVFLALPALALVEIRNRKFWNVRSIAQRAAGFAVVWIVVDILKRNVNRLGPAGGDWSAGSLTQGPETFAKWLSFVWSDYSTRLWELLTWGIPDMLGIRTFPIKTYGLPSQLEAGFRIAALAFAVAALIALARLVRLAGTSPPESRREGLRFCLYLALVAVQNILIYGLNGGILLGAPAPLRYALFAPLLVVALFGAYFLVERSTRWTAAVGVAIAIWAAGNVVDNARLIQEYVGNPPSRQHRILADYLMSHGIRYARGKYWDAYIVSFLSREKVIVASTETVRISAYQSEVEQHASEAVTLQRLPCDAGVKVEGWCVIGPPGR